MFKHWIVVFLLMFCLLPSNNLAIAEQPNLEQQIEIRNVFNEYKRVLLGRDGKRYVSLIDQKSVRYFKRIKSLAQQASARQLSEIALSDAVAVLHARQRFSKEELDKLSPQEFIIQNANQGVSGEAGVKSMELGKIEITKNSAKGEFLRGFDPVPKLFHSFSKEDDVWKIDLVSSNKQSEQYLQKMLERSEFDRRRFVLKILKVEDEAEANSLWPHQ